MPAWYSRVALIAALAVPALADYSPFKVGRTWVYQGVGATVDPLHHRRVGDAPIRFKETLTLKVLAIRARGAATVISVEERDSLYDRKRQAYVGATPTAVYPDTVITRLLDYVQGNGLRLEGGDTLVLGHRDSADLFFPTVSAAPAGRPIPGLQAPWRGVEGRDARPWKQAELYVMADSWYLEDVGLYWVRMRTYAGTCDFVEQRELKLATMDGKPIDPGIDPPGSALPKEARIACGLAVPRRGLAPAFAPRAGGSFADILGRALLPAAP